MYMQIGSINILKNKKTRYPSTLTSNLEDVKMTFAMTLDLLIKPSILYIYKIYDSFQPEHQT